ncbi:MAG: DUF1549 domain-containing protein [Planctomyces sp.]|nr:DUF1549 domain-containing protein [Planctomyces sp.]
MTLHIHLTRSSGIRTIRAGCMLIWLMCGAGFVRQAAIASNAPSPDAQTLALEQAPEKSRVQSGLQALYRFQDVTDGIIRDESGSGEPLNLRIDKPQATAVRSGRFHIQSAVVIASDGPATKVINAVKASKEFTLEAWLKPLDSRQAGPARIISLSSDPSNRNLTLGQDKNRFDVRLRSSTTDNNGMPSTPWPDDSVKSADSHVMLTRAFDGALNLYSDGRLMKTASVPGTFDNWADDYRLVIANELSGDRPWHGEIALVAVYSRALSAEEVAVNFEAGPPAGVNYASMLPAATADPVDFVSDVQPIFRKHCYECHSGDQEDGGLNLGIRQRALQGGHNGPAFVVGDSSQSRMVHLAAGIDQSLVMPPESEGLSDAEIGIIRAWIDQGANWPVGVDIADPREEKARTHWAFQPLHNVELPTVVATTWIRTEIDRFILSRLEAESMQPAPPAEPEKLIRRISFDLIGMPPTPEETDEFIQACQTDRESAVKELVDRMLASPHYGERWGRHWLDVARYADSDGQESDRDRPTAWHYRDFVLKSFNVDRPYDEFIRWQLAGDEYQPENPEAVAATGFLAAGPFAALPDRLMEDERLRNRYNELDDMMSTVGTGMLGLTLGCVRCHDHKYDAIPARDYYRMLSAFHSGERAEVPLGNTGEKVLGYRDIGPEPGPTWLYQRGNYYDRDQPVSLGFVSILTNGRTPEEFWQVARAESPASNSSGQRRALAEWMTDVDHGAGALLARVFVNRIWQHHFGYGIVRTVGDFGVRSDSPTHPKLLEWLANDFVRNGWQVKRIHRMILLSSTWQQSVVKQQQGDAEASGKSDADPDNRLLSEMRLTRLEGEVLRDSMLVISGSLDRSLYGPAVKPPIAQEAILARNLKDGYPDNISDAPQLRRRSVYLFHKRVVPYPLLQAFDKPDAQQSCSKRDRTTVAPQALALLNDPFVRTVSLEFADRLIREQAATSQNSDVHDMVVRGYRLAVGRIPTASELTASVQFIESQQTRRIEASSVESSEAALRAAVGDFCQVLFSLNEFLYVD